VSGVDETRSVVSRDESGGDLGRHPRIEKAPIMPPSRSGGTRDEGIEWWNSGGFAFVPADQNRAGSGEAVAPTHTKLAEQRNNVEHELSNAVYSDRRAHRSCSEIGAMLGVSKQAAQRMHGLKASV